MSYFGAAMDTRFLGGGGLSARFKTSYVIGLFAFILSTNTALAQSQGYDETVIFLKEKLTTIVKFDDGHTIRNSFIEKSKCSFIYKMTSTKNGRETSYSQSSFNARDFDPSTVMAVEHYTGDGRYNVDAYITNNKKLVKFKSFYGKILEYEHEFVFFNRILAPEKDNAPRVARAFRHLISLCGGREQLF